MTLEGLTYVPKEVITAFYKGVKTESDIKEFFNGTLNYLLDKQHPLFGLIEAEIQSSNDPGAVRRTAYTILHLIGAASANEKLEESLKASEHYHHAEH